MTKIAILDTESTGLTEDAQIIELAYLTVNYPTLGIIKKDVDLYFKPTIPIQYGAKAVHHILEFDLLNYDEVNSSNYNLEIDTINSYDYFIGHNIDHDWKLLGSPENVKRIDTLAIARKLLPDLDSKIQSALMYYFFDKEAREEVTGAHNALADVYMCLKVLIQLLSIAVDLYDYPEEESNFDTIEKLWNFSEWCRIPDTMHFGKHYGKTYLEVAKTDPGYFNWWETKSDTPPDMYQKQAIVKAFIDKKEGK